MMNKLIKRKRENNETGIYFILFYFFSTKQAFFIAVLQNTFPFWQYFTTHLASRVEKEKAEN